MTSRIVSDLSLGASLAYEHDAGAPTREPKVVLLTGATGFLGRYLLRDLLTRSSTDEIVCLVRARDDAAARTRVLAMRPGGPDSTAAETDRIRAVAVDITKPGLGMSAQALALLAERIDTVFHCAARINLIHAYGLLRSPNVLGTYELLKLAGRGPTKTFHHISSLMVLGSALLACDVPACEDVSIPYSDGLSVGYSQSKWVAEQLVNAAARNGLRACIYRPAAITGDSRSGASNPCDAASLMLTACVELRAAPDCGNRLYILPVDYVSRVIVELACQPASAGKAFHILNRRPVPWVEVTAVLSDGYIDRVLPYRQWVDLVRRHSSDRPNGRLSQLLCILPESPGQGRSPLSLVDDRNTQCGIAARPDIGCAEEDRVVIRRYAQWLADNHATEGSLDIGVPVEKGADA